MPPHLKNYCNGHCEGDIKATGVVTNCSSITSSVDLSDPVNNGTTVFAVDFARGEDNVHMPTLTFTATYSVAVDNSTYIATIINDTCDVKIASVQYPVVVENQTITLNSDKYPNIGELKPYAGDSRNASQGDPAGPLGGLSWNFDIYWWASSKAIRASDPKTNATRYEIILDPVADRYYNHRKAGVGVKDEYCIFTFNQPTDDIVKSLPQIMFRAGLYFAAGNDIRNTPMVQTTATLVYRSEYSWFGIAVAIMTIATFSCIIPLWGWWELGRKVTLNPIETAKAFSVPRFRTAGLGCDGKDIVKKVGDIQVGYVQVQLQDATGKSISSMELRPLETAENTGR